MKQEIKSVAMYNYEMQNGQDIKINCISLTSLTYQKTNAGNKNITFASKLFDEKKLLTEILMEEILFVAAEKTAVENPLSQK